MEKELLKITDDTKDFTGNVNFSELVTSKRTFGVELEMILGNVNKLNSFCQNNGHDLHRDGSIVGDNAIEVASDILCGKDGADKLTTLVNTSKELGFKTNGTCGMHIHLGAKDYYTKGIQFSEVDIKNVDLTNYDTLFVELPLLNQMRKVFGAEQLSNFILESFSQFYESNNNSYYTNYTMYDGRTSNICIVPCMYMGNWVKILIRVSTIERLKLKPLSLSQQTSTLNIDKDTTEVYRSRSGRECADIGINKVTVFTRKTNREWVRLRSLLSVYSYFDDLFFAMLPKNRKKSEYCRPLNNTYSYDDISKVSSQEKLEKLWYKEQKIARVAQAKRQRGALHGDFNTRYHSLNIHALFYENGHNTIEIRTHHGTLNTQSILAWVMLHQRILDSVSQDCHSYIENISYLNKNSTIEEKAKEFFKIFSIEKDSPLYQFIKHRLSVYSSINLK